MRRSSAPPVRRRGLLAAALALGLLCGLALSGCKTVDKIRMKTLGVMVCEPAEETAEWVIMEALLAGKTDSREKGWERLQAVLHTSERSPAALRSWNEMVYPRLRRQADHYLDGDGCFRLVNFREMQNGGIDFYVESHRKEMPTPCSVYADGGQGGRWRIKRCSL